MVNQNHLNRDTEIFYLALLALGNRRKWLEILLLFLEGLLKKTKSGKSTDNLDIK